MMHDDALWKCCLPTWACGEPGRPLWPGGDASHSTGRRLSRSSSWCDFLCDAAVARRLARRFGESRDSGTPSVNPLATVP